LQSFNCAFSVLLFLAEPYYVTFGLWHYYLVCLTDSVYRLYVTLLPRQRLELFGKFLHL